MNVGNYTGALDKLIPGLGATVEGFKNTTKAALAFIATPIGAVIGALGLAVAALTQYFKGSEEGQDKLAKVMAIGKGIFEGFLVAVEKVGEVVFMVGEALMRACPSSVEVSSFLRSSLRALLAFVRFSILCIASLVSTSNSRITVSFCSAICECV